MENITQRLEHLIPLEKLQSALQRFCTSIGVGCIIVEPKGKVLIEEGWQCFCKNHRARLHPPTFRSCIEVEDFHTGKLAPGEKTFVFNCDNGFSCACAPIIVEGLHLANIFIGLFLLSPIELDKHKKNAVAKGFEGAVYLSAAAKIPVFSAEKVQLTLSHLELFVELVNEMGRNVLLERRANQDLKKSEERYRHMVNSLPQAVCETNLQGICTFANKSAHEIFGYTPQELNEGLNLIQFISADDHEKLAVRFKLLLSGEILEPEEYCFIRKDGSFFPGIVFSRPIYADEKVQGIRLVIIDDTHRKQDKEKLQQGEAKLRSLFQAVPVGLTILKDRMLLLVNERLCEITGYESSALLYHSSRHLYESEEEYNRVGTALYGSLQAQGPSYVETQFRHRDGSLRKVSLYAAPLNPGDLNAGAAVAIQDITLQKRAEEALRRSEDRLSIAISATSDAIWEWFPQSNTSYYSPRWYEMLGYADQEFPMNLEAWKKLCHPYDYQIITNTTQQAMASSSNTGFTSEFRMRHRDGAWVWILTRGKVMQRDMTGAPLLLTGTNTDITQHKLAEIALQENEKRYRTLFEAASDAILILKDGLITDCNPKTLELFRCSRQQIIGRSPIEISPPLQPDGRSFAERGDKYINNALQGRQQHFDWLQSRFDGTLFHAEVSLNSIELSGEKILQAIVRDITKRKNAERALRESEFRFRSFYNSNPEGIIFMDFQGVILDINKALLTSSGYLAPEAVVNKHFKDFVPDAYHSQVVQTILALKSGILQTEPLLIAYIDQNGANIPISAKGWRVTDEESTPLYLGFFIRDLTKEMVLAEEKITLEKQVIQAQKSEAIGTLAGGIAHDFNNILGGIIGYTELALYRNPSTVDHKVHEYLKRVLEGGNRAKDLVQQILRFSRHSNMVMVPINLAPVIQESIHLLRSTLPTTIEIRYKVDFASDRILGDPTQIHQVVMNLATNAYHAMRETGGLITISLENVTLKQPRQFVSMTIPPGEYLRLRVADTGSGIQPAVLERIFEPYFTTKNVNEGTGLGMAVVRGIIKSHKGLIEIETVLGKGTCFDVFLPLTQSMVAEVDCEENHLPLGHGERVLIVDDESFFLEVVQESLKLLGYLVTGSQSSIATLKTFRDDPQGYDLLITDQTMPEMTGVQLTQEIRKISTTLPVILCTGYSETVTEQSAHYYGVTEFLMKPVNIYDLAKTIEAVLSPRRAV